MKSSTLANTLWGHKAKLSYLLIASCILLLTFLGSRDLWTQEHRWADIVSGMFARQDFLHPYLGLNRYYDKPLLSYWLMVGIVKVTGLLNTWALRLPSALSGLLAIWSIYRLGRQLKSRSMGLLAGWLLLTTFYFLFWARTSSADMLNLAGSLLAVAWYMQKRKAATITDYSIFFLIIALTALCKGLVGAIVPLIAVFVDVCLQRAWQQHLKLRILLALVPATLIYLAPFLASSYFGGDSYGQNGLYLVYKENILRYFQPFDHQGPIYTYFIYLPLYLFPWAFLLIPALWTLPKRWRQLTLNEKWISWTLLALFLFFTLSGSRRSYYVLPIVPFAILLISDWVVGCKAKWVQRLVASLSLFSLFAWFLVIDILPAWYYHQYGIERFATMLKMQAEKVKPWQQWEVVSLDAESKVNFYLNLPPDVKTYSLPGNLRNLQTSRTFAKTWPILAKKPANTIFITRQLYVAALQPYFKGYRIVEISIPSTSLFSQDAGLPVAFIPLM